MNPKNLIAHRGDNTHYPENTLIAIESALKQGALAFEFDLQMNADHSLIAFHDADVWRMTGDNNEKIFNLNDDDLNKLSIHEPNQFDSRHYPTRVTFLKDILKLMKRYPRAQAFIEIKDESLAHWGVSFVMDKLIQSLKGFKQQAVIISFNQQALLYTKAHSHLKIGLVFEEYSERIKSNAIKLKAEHLICWYKILPKEKVWQGNWQWMVYTVNDIELAKKLLARGDIDFVETDDIQLLLKA